MRYHCFAAMILTLGFVIPAFHTQAATPKEAVGFFGTITGTVKTAQADGTSFTLAITKAEADEKTSAVKDTAPMVGKVITLGTRMPKKEGKAAPHVDDVAFIKTLKPGTIVTVKVFAVRADPSVLRIIEPGKVEETPRATSPK